MWKDSRALVLQFLGDVGNAWGCVVWVVATTGPSELGFADKEKRIRYVCTYFGSAISKAK